MFVLPNNLVKKIIKGDESYDSVFSEGEITETIERNEVTKGYKFEDQAKVNLALEKNYSVMCSVLESECLKENCTLFKGDGAGKLKKGWVCREYKIDFPEAPFDSRYHVSHIGVGSVDFRGCLNQIEKLKDKGAKYICIGCHKTYETKRTELYEDGHGGRMLEMCTCGSDLFEDIDSFLKHYRDELKK